MTMIHVYVIMYVLFLKKGIAKEIGMPYSKKLWNHKFYLKMIVIMHILEFPVWAKRMLPAFFPQWKSVPLSHDPKHWEVFDTQIKRFGFDIIKFKSVLVSITILLLSSPKLSKNGKIYENNELLYGFAPL